MKFTRRKLLRYSLIAGCAGIGLGGYVWQVEPRWISYEEHDLPIAGLAPHLIGKTLVQISDLHVGDQVGDQYLLNQFQYIDSLSPDFVCYTGDFIDHGHQDFINKIKRLLPKFSKGKLGTAGVLGNHDYERHTANCKIAVRLGSELKDSGIPILFNESIEMNGLTVSGLEDFWSPRFRESESHDVVQSLPDSSLVLSHNPDTADLPIWDGYKNWILCGHTHGGQCRIPGFSPPFLPVNNRDYVAGKYQLAGGHKMYINRGVGHTMKVRFCVRPEITIFTLRSLDV